MVSKINFSHALLNIIQGQSFHIHGHTKNHIFTQMLLKFKWLLHFPHGNTFFDAVESFAWTRNYPGITARPLWPGFLFSSMFKLHLFGSLFVLIWQDSINIAGLRLQFYLLNLTLILLCLCAMHFHFRDTVTNVDVSPEDMRNIIKLIADTGKFWY